MLKNLLFFPAVCVVFSTLSIAQENQYATSKVDIATNTNWSEISFKGETARLFYELLDKNGAQVVNHGAGPELHSGAWECLKTEYNLLGEKLENPFFSCHGQFDGKGSQFER